MAQIRRTVSWARGACALGSPQKHPQRRRGLVYYGQHPARARAGLWPMSACGRRLAYATVPHRPRAHSSSNEGARIMKRLKTFGGHLLREPLLLRLLPAAETAGTVGGSSAASDDAATGTTYKIGVLQLTEHAALDSANEGFVPRSMTRVSPTRSISRTRRTTSPRVRRSRPSL